MNTRQRSALIGVAILTVASVLYPPYYYPQNEVGVNHGHNWLLSFGPGRVEGVALLAELLAIGMIGIIAYLVLADDKR